MVLDLPTAMIQVPEGQEWITEMINSILIEVLSSMAEQERLTIRKRQRQGIEAAKAKGKHLGRRLMDTARQYAESKAAGGIMLTTAQTNFRGQGLYEHMGYEKLGVHHSGEFLYLLTL